MSDETPPAAGPVTTLTGVHRSTKEPVPWWRDAVVYQIYPRSFADSDGDGMGDLAGITAKLGHLARLGVDALWLSPFYRSPQADAGYDVADYRDVDPRFGTLADFDELLKAAHCQGLKVVVDIVPNHTSDEHAWFREALASPPGSAARARYVFRDGKNGGEAPPNDWESMFGGPAWHRVTEADGLPGQWYLHLFDVKQPDLNWENPEVRAEFADVYRFWLDRGVDGFRIDVAHGMIKDPSLPDRDGAPAKMPMDLARVVMGAGDMGPMWDQEGIHEIFQEWRAVADEYEGDRMLCGEAWVEPPERLARYVRPGELHQAFNFAYQVTPLFPPLMRAVIEATLRAFDDVEAPATWVLSSHDVPRHASRYGLTNPIGWMGGIGPASEQPDEELGLARARAATLVQLALPGVAYLYQGEELGLPEATDIPDDARQDPVFARTGGEEYGRDGCRVPLPWAADEPAYGFSPTGASWLPQPASFARYALDRQKGVAGSTYEFYRSALRIRRDFKLGTGSLGWVDLSQEGADDGVLALVNRRLLVVANFGLATVRLPGDLNVVHASMDLPLAEDGAIHVPPNAALWALLD